jgi:hypothetical protein
MGRRTACRGLESGVVLPRDRGVGSDDDVELGEGCGLCDAGAVRLWGVLLWRRGWLGFV